MTWFCKGKCTSTARLEGKMAIITGSNTGIGKATVEDFVRRGARVIMACRDSNKAEEAAEDIRSRTRVLEGAGEVVTMKLDLASQKSILEFAQLILDTEPSINLLVNNAGVMMCPRSETAEGLEMQFGVNHIGHFLLTCKLLPRILRSTPARIVTVSSSGHLIGTINFEDLNSKKSYSPTYAYAQSKLANVLFSRELAKRLEGRGVNTYSLHPGAVNTELQRHVDDAFFSGSEWILRKGMQLFGKNAEQGAQTSIYCSVDEKTADETGLYYVDCKKSTPSAKARDDETAARLWEESVKIVGLDLDPFTAADPGVSRTN